MKVVVVIPAYNEERTVGEVVGKCKMQPFLSPPFQGGDEEGVKTIVVDDGSTDRTAEVARAAGAIVLRHPINRGLGAALSTGIDGAIQLITNNSITNNSIIVTLDADLQHDPAEIARVIQPILEGQAEVVIGSRFMTTGQHDNRTARWIPITRKIGNWCGNFFTWLLFGIWVTDSQSGFRAFSGAAAEKLRLRTSTMEVSSEIIREIARLKLKMAEVPITVKYDKYSLSKGQGFLRGLETLWKLIVLKFFR
ncbi:glycosyltransferase family 2 protein [Candidatus Uhrbacteria bacterium]|nr:glycosyltransferase family 2 protein [Candidatus Uhrbacteria bacterium]